MKAPLLLKHGLFGFGMGAVVSVLFFPLNFVLGFVLLVLLLYRFLGGTPDTRAKHLIAGGIGLATVAVAIVLPVKQLDGRVGPFHYGRMSLNDLCQTISREHSVLVGADRTTGTNMMDSFATERVITRREVLEKLAHEANCELHIGYCGTGATFLFGAHPSFTRLHSRVAQPDRARNGP